MHGFQTIQSQTSLFSTKKLLTSRDQDDQDVSF